MRHAGPAVLVLFLATGFGVATSDQLSAPQGKTKKPITAEAAPARAPAPAEIVTRGLVAHYNFDEGAGKVLRDITGRGNDGKIRGAAYVRMKEGFALKFDGRNDYVDCGSRRDLRPVSQVTIELWIRADFAGTYEYETGVAGSAPSGFGFSFCPDRHTVNHGLFYWQVASSVNSAAYLVSLETWHHLVGTFDGRTRKVYLDGELGTSVEARGEFINARRFAIGKSGGYGPSFKGMMDQLRVYNRALSAEEVRTNYRASRPHEAANEVVSQGLVAHYDCTEGSGDTLHDTTRRGNHGKIHGATYVKVKEGFALRFDGTDDYVDCGNSRDFDPEFDLTIEAWVWADKAATEKRLAGVVGKAPWWYGFSFVAAQGAENEGLFSWHINGEENKASALLSLETWHHLIGTFDGATLSLYADGELADTRESASEFVTRGPHFNLGRPGTDPAGTSEGYFKGMIGQIRVYQRALSAEDVRTNYRATRGLFDAAAEAVREHRRENRPSAE